MLGPWHVRGVDSVCCLSGGGWVCIELIRFHRLSSLPLVIPGPWLIGALVPSKLPLSVGTRPRKVYWCHTMYHVNTGGTKGISEKKLTESSELRRCLHHTCTDVWNFIIFNLKSYTSGSYILKRHLLWILNKVNVKSVTTPMIVKEKGDQRDDLLMKLFHPTPDGSRRFWILLWWNKGMKSPILIPHSSADQELLYSPNESSIFTDCNRRRPAPGKQSLLGTIFE